jgi:hypothetical protein
MVEMMIMTMKQVLNLGEKKEMKIKPKGKCILIGLLLLPAKMQ